MAGVLIATGTQLLDAKYVFYGFRYRPLTNDYITAIWLVLVTTKPPRSVTIMCIAMFHTTRVFFPYAYGPSHNAYTGMGNPCAYGNSHMRMGQPYAYIGRACWISSTS